MFVFQTKLDRMVGVRNLQKNMVEGNHIPEVPDGTSFVGYVITHSFGGSAALTMGYFYDAATRHAPLTANAVNGYIFQSSGKMVLGWKLYASNFFEGSLFEGSGGLWGSHCVDLPAHGLFFYIPGQCVRCAHCCPVTN
jgi:hypothetical protein